MLVLLVDQKDLKKLISTFRGRSVWRSPINQSRRSTIVVTLATCDLLQKGTNNIYFLSSLPMLQRGPFQFHKFVKTKPASPFNS
jgi:hypothetical protein